MSRLVTTFTTFAGSTANAQALVEGLRTGTSISLVDASNTTTTFTPATGAMGWGNVKIALALAQAELTHAGITNPTPADIEAALNGGTVTTGTTSTTFAGVLAQRASGMGWGQIAHADALNLGKVVSAVSKPAGAGSGHAAMMGSAQSGKGVVTAGGNPGAATSHSKASAGMVTAAGNSVALVSTAKGHAAVGAMTTGNGDAVTSSVATAAGTGPGNSARHAHGKGNSGG